MNDNRPNLELGFYEKAIVADTRCPPDDAWKVETVMREHIFHSTLDHLNRAQLRRGALEAWALLNAERALFEDYFAQTQRKLEDWRRDETQAAQAAQRETTAREVTA